MKQCLKGRALSCTVAIPLLLIFLIISAEFCACRGPQNDPLAPEEGVPLQARLVLKADVSRGTVPLTVNFLLSLEGPIDTIFTRLPEVSLLGGYNPEEALYAPLSDSVTSARRSYSGREHYFRTGVFKAVMVLHGIHGDMYSDTVQISVD
jgi:hypothetical protein